MDDARRDVAMSPCSGIVLVRKGLVDALHPPGAAPADGGTGHGRRSKFQGVASARGPTNHWRGGDAV